VVCHSPIPVPRSQRFTLQKDGSSCARPLPSVDPGAGLSACGRPCRASPSLRHRLFTPIIERAVEVWGSLPARARGCVVIAEYSRDHARAVAVPALPTVPSTPLTHFFFTYARRMPAPRLAIPSRCFIFLRPHRCCPVLRPVEGGDGKRLPRPDRQAGRHRKTIHRGGASFSPRSKAELSRLEDLGAAKRSRRRLVSTVEHLWIPQ